MVKVVAELKQRCNNILETSYQNIVTKSEIDVAKPPTLDLPTTL